MERTEDNPLTAVLRRDHGDVHADGSETTPIVRTKTREEIDRDGFTSSIPFDSTSADCVVICCSDHRFEEQNEDFVKALGFVRPHFIQVPSGVAVFSALIAATGFLHKGMNALLDKAIELTGVRTVLCIGHEDCGGYKAGQNKIVQFAARHLVHKSIPEIQCEHLSKAGKIISRNLGNDVTVSAYYASTAGDRVRYGHIGTWPRS